MDTRQPIGIIKQRQSLVMMDTGTKLCGPNKPESKTWISETFFSTRVIDDWNAVPGTKCDKKKCQDYQPEATTPI